MTVPPADDTVRKPSNLLLRVVSAAVMAPVAIGAAWWGGWVFAGFWVLAALAVLWEWVGLVAGRDYRMLVLSCGGAIVLAAVLARTDHPVAAVLLMALGALAASIFVPRAQRLWIVAGIGFTMALFIANLAFPEGQRLEQAKAAILAASTIAMIGGLLAGRLLLKMQPEAGAATSEAEAEASDVV